ncbi:MAG: hypothetical protein ACR2JV_05880 [Gaiellales bacterium]
MPLIPRRRKRGWDEQPVSPCAVLLAADGRRRFSRRAIAEAIALSPSGPVAVVTIARIHGTQFGLPNPGLMPTKQEMRDRHAWVGAAVDAITTAGGTADGQVAVTRKATKTLARIARTRGAQRIVIDETAYTGLRRFIEGDVGSELAKRLRTAGVEVTVIPFDPADPAP